MITLHIFLSIQLQRHCTLLCSSCIDEQFQVLEDCKMCEVLCAADILIRIWISKERANREQHLGDGEGRTPLILQYIQTNATVAVYVGVINSRCKCHWMVHQKF